MVKIVVIEDEPYMREEITAILEKVQYHVYCVEDFVHGAAEVLRQNPSLVLLDLNLPGISGYEICKAIRQKSTVPILVLTGREQLRDELHALGLGADEFLNKPCHRDRLLMRIAALLRRSRDRSNLVEAEGIRLDIMTYTMYYNDRSIVLPENQGKIMELLLSHPGELVTGDMLFEKLWATREYVDENALQVNMTRLRKTLAQFHIDCNIITVRGKGYLLQRKDEKNA